MSNVWIVSEAWVIYFMASGVLFNALIIAWLVGHIADEYFGISK